MYFVYHKHVLKTSFAQLMSAACCAGHYRHTNKFIIIHFDDGNVSEGFNWECSFCLNIMYAKLRVQNKTLTKIN